MNDYDTVLDSLRLTHYAVLADNGHDYVCYTDQEAWPCDVARLVGHFRDIEHDLWLARIALKGRMDAIEQGGEG